MWRSLFCVRSLFWPVDILRSGGAEDPEALRATLTNDSFTVEGTRISGKLPKIFSGPFTNVSEFGESLIFWTLHGGRVFKVLMDFDGLAGKKRAALFSFIAHREDVIELLACILIDALGTLVGHVNAQLAHDRNGLGPYMARLGAATEHFEAVARIM